MTITRANTYRTGRSENRFFAYSRVVVPSTPSVEFTIDKRYWFLCRKIHLINYVNTAASSSPFPYALRILDTRMNRAFQSTRLAANTVGGNVMSPNILPAPILFEPKTTVLLDLDRSGTRVHYCFEGEHLTNPEPAWVEKMKRRYWYQQGATDLAVTGTYNFPLKDDGYDFAIGRILSRNTLDGVLSNANPGTQRINEIGPNRQAWSNDDEPNLNYGGAFANGAGATVVDPPRVVTTPATLEVISQSLPASVYVDLVFDGVKFPRGTRLEDWL